jgi:hypothetical protein
MKSKKAREFPFQLGLFRRYGYERRCRRAYGTAVSRYSVVEEDATRREKFSGEAEYAIERVLCRLQKSLLFQSEVKAGIIFPSRASLPLVLEPGVIFPGQAMSPLVLEPNSSTVALLLENGNQIFDAISDENEQLTARLEMACFFGLQFGQAIARYSFNVAVRRGSSGGHREPETTKKQKSVHDRFAIPLKKFFGVYQDHWKKAGLTFSQLVDGFRECIREFIPEWEADDDAQLHEFAKKLRGKAGINGDGVMSAKNMMSTYLHESPNKS